MYLKIITIAALCLSVLSVNGQITHTHKLDVGLGHEWNAFLAPSTLIEEDDELFREDLWDNGTFQSLSLQNGFKIEGKNHRIKLKVNGSLGLFQTEQNSNRYTYRIGASYRAKYASKKYFEFEPEFFRKKREGINTDNAVLATPFSYSLLRIPVAFDFYLGKKAWLKTQAGYLFKNYDKANGEKLLYHAPFFEAMYSKKWQSDRFIKKVSLTSTSQLRNYQTLSLLTDLEDFDEDDPELELEYREGSRDWTYQFTTLKLDLTNINKSNSVALGLYHISRIDQNSRSTFNEIGPGIAYETTLQKIELKSSVRYTIRNYTRLAPGAENTTPLQYHYLRLNAALNYRLNKKSQIYCNTHFVNRTSNNPNLDAMSFRDYFNGYMEIGVRWSW